MKKKIAIFLAVVITMLSLIALMVITTSAEDNSKTITISYMDASEPTSSTTSLDKTAYSGGKQTVVAGEKFTLPTTANLAYVGEEGYQLRWYTSDGRTYGGGETVSFTEDTKLFRVVAKEVYSVDEISSALASNSHGAILMADMSATNAYITVYDQNHGILDLGGHTLAVSKNGSLMGTSRSAKIIVGKGTLKMTNPDNKVGEYGIINCPSHTYNGDRNKAMIGKDVFVDAPNFYLCINSDGGTQGYPWILVYGTLNVYGVLSRPTTSNPNATIDFFEGCYVTVGGPWLVKDYKPTQTDIYNKSANYIRIYGGTFNLPAEAENESFWTTDNTSNKDELTVHNKDLIKIEGGTFILPDNKVPAISAFLTEDYIGATGVSHYGFVKNKSNISFEFNYKFRRSYYFTLNQNGTLVVVDNMGTGIGGTYYFDAVCNTSTNLIDAITVYDDAEKTIPITKFNMKAGMTSFMISLPSTSVDYKLQTMVVDGKNYNVVVTALCGTNAAHSFNSTEDATVEANCQHAAYANYVCSGCGYSAYFNWGEKQACSYSETSNTQATATTLGNKIFTCSGCGETKSYPYTVDPTNLEVTVTIRNDDDTFETVTVMANEIFDFATSGTEGAYIYTVVAIKKFGEYNIRNIYGIKIPVGIMFISIVTHNTETYNKVNYGVTELEILDGANVSIGNIGNLRRLKTIKVGAANVKFGRSCSYFNPNNEKRDLQVIETIDLSTPGATVYFDDYAFDSRKTVKNLLLADNSTYTFGYKAFYNSAIDNLDLTKNSTYSFYGESFYGADFESLIIPDNATNITFDGSPFKSTLTKYLYIGKNFLITSSAFSDMTLLEKVVIMDGVKLDKYRENLFSNAGSSDFATPLYVFNHSVDFKDLPKQTFNNCDGIFYYTVADIGTRGDIFNNCAAVSITDESGNTISYPKWTIVTGIPHPVISKTINPQCEESGYQTWISEICPCGTHLTETATAKKYVDVYKLSTQTPVETNEYAVVEIPALGHATDGQKLNIVYLTGYMGVGNTTYICTRCEKEHTVEGDAKALFAFHGYSIREDGTAFCIDYGINMTAIKDYELASGATMNVGVFAMTAEKLGDKSPHEVMNSESKYINAIIPKDEGISNLTLKIRGFNTDEQKAISLVMSAYLKETKVVDEEEVTSMYYFQDQQTDKPTAYSMAQYLTDTENVA